MTQTAPAPVKLVRRAALAAAAAALLAMPAASSLAQTPQPGSAVAPQPDDAPLPGYWQYSYHVSIIPAGDEMKCLSKNDVKRFFDGLCNKGSKCTYTTNDAHDGKVRLVGEWIDHKGRHTQLSGSGVYDQKAFKLKAHVVLHLGLTIPVDGTIEGHYVSAECPAGSESPKKGK